MKGIASNYKINCNSEYSTLKKVLVVKPAFMKIKEVINETQKHYEVSNIDTTLALKQHAKFLDVMRAQGVKVIELSPEPRLNEQVFTRDIAFAINDELFVASMSEEVRQSETKHLKKWLHEHSISFHDGLAGTIEGGDVLIDGDTVWVGLSGRTTIEGIQDLQQRIPDHSVQPLEIKDDILHLDCVLNIISENTALVYPQAFTKKDLRTIKSNYKVIYITDEEQFQMGPNVLSIGDGKIISLPQNERLNKVLESKGFEVILVDISEIIKSGGSFRCCTLPLQRS
ncbi:hypothetical protein CEY16_13215 [Halalkalibacillus sediminis]|uniref:N(G),N(G)-dimethylarginine dimethylaminohydrolase n=1 Tax=Halalkalibacillus sediminis TaxID=2018042 RepID=A0A2I0QR14_9BACI|nr:arginine deiminase family protein [Halalkalibacillus sediminis]PKR76774.1 hypothetical protein CEY16_13215 [Halalkalibacillus sediminis]